MKRPHIPLSTKLAAALVALFKVPYEHAKLMTEDQVLSLAHWDHYPITKEAGGPDAHYNLVPLEIIPHRIKTATVDIPMLAKVKRLQRKNTTHHVAFMGIQKPARQRPKRKIPQHKNPWPPKGSRKLSSRRRPHD